jgi:hypothetical protein
MMASHCKSFTLTKTRRKRKKCCCFYMAFLSLPVWHGVQCVCVLFVTSFDSFPSLFPLPSSLFLSSSPPLPISSSPRLPVSARPRSPRLLVSSSPRLPVSSSPHLPALPSYQSLCNVVILSHPTHIRPYIYSARILTRI